MSKEVQKVDVAVRIAGDYAAWHEISHSIMWDFTNDVKTGYHSKEDAEEALEEGHDREYSDCEMKEAILFEGNYYVKL